MKIKSFLIATTIILSGCSNKIIHIQHNNSLYGSWYQKEAKDLNYNIKIDITNKEQFFKNGTLLSTKWFNFKDKKSGKNLGEYYITKLFTWQAKKGNIIEVKFKRCSTGITQKLMASGLGYEDLSQKCKQQKVTNKISKKHYQLLKENLILGSKTYKRN